MTAPAASTAAPAVTQLISITQEQLWFLDQLGHGASYNTPLRLRLRGRLDAGALGRGLQAIVDRHEVLRSSYPERDGQPTVRIASRMRVALPVEDLSQLAAPEREAAAQRSSREDAEAGFDLARGPLVRARLIRLAGDDHLLLFTSHHIVSDGWSLGVFLAELAALYTAELAGAPPRLPELAVQYLDYAVWQRSRLAGPAGAAALDYWRQRLCGASGVLALPYDRPPSPGRIPVVASHRIALPAVAVARLRALARSGHATLFIVGLTTFQALLARIAGQDDVCIATPVINRPDPELERLIGYFVETMVVRCDASGDPSFAALLARTRSAVLADLSHKELPFGLVVQAVGVERLPGRAPLVQAMFELDLEGELGRAPRVALPGLTVEMSEGVLGRAKFDLVLKLVEAGDELTAVFDYASDAFDAQTIERLARRYANLVEQVAADPARPLSELSLITDDERHTVVVEWNATAAPELSSGWVHRMIAEQAARRPGDIAVVYEGEAVSYGELDRRANRLAHHLRARGVGRNVVVGVLMDRSIELVVSLLAVLKAGGAYLPLDPALPDERLAFMVADSRMPVVLVRPGMAGALAFVGPQLILVEPGSRAFAGEPDRDPDAALDPDDLAYVIYTSGSTGAPKAVMNVHGALTNRLRWMQQVFGLGPADRVLQKTPASFDVSVWEFFWPLMAGARLVVARPEGHRDPVYLARVLTDERVTTVHFVPSMLEAMLSAGALAGCRDLVRVIASGEALPFELVERFFAGCGAELHNLYGPTEAAIDVSAWRCRPGDPRGIVPIGRPIANLQLYILDPGLAPCPPGLAGELYIAGAGLARGYLGRPGLTAERFVPCPFSAQPGARMYRTGDAARFLDDGNIEYLGRLDHQIKLRGFRIELGEIEHALLAVPGVRAAAVVCQRDAAGEVRLAAHVVRDVTGPGGDDGGALRAWLEARLPAYMVPSAFVVHRELPMTPSGKLDRKALPVVDLAAASARPRVPPVTPTEALVARLWADLLKIDPPGRDDDFFRLGGHSLLATQLVARLARDTGLGLPLAAVFAHPRLDALAAAIDARHAAGSTAATEAVTEASTARGEVPLSYGQERMWLLQALAPGSAAYHMSGAVRIRGALDPARLERALAALVARHAPLRTAFSEVGGTIRARVTDGSGPIGVRRLAVAAGRPATADAALSEILEAEARRAFDLRSGRLLRAVIVELGAGDAIALLTVHHIACDGWSLSIMLRELTALYRGAALPPLPITYADHARSQRAAIEGPRGAELVAYWKQHLAGAPRRLELPRDRPGDPATASRAGQVRAVIAAEVVAAMHRLERDEGATPFMILLAAYAAVLGDRARQRDVVIGVPVAGRSAQTEELVGCFVDTVALRVELIGELSFRALVRRVRATALGGFAHQELPFERVLREVGAARAADETPLVQAFLNFLDLPPADLDLDDATVEHLAVPDVGAKLDLSLYARPRPADEVIELELVYRDDRYDRTRMVDLVDRIVGLLGDACVAPDRPLAGDGTAARAPIDGPAGAAGLEEFTL